MDDLIGKIDKSLADLAWSLWTEFGVRGIARQHSDCLILLEELIILTAVIGESDPRLRNEALDWCSKYHNFVSISRLQTLIKELGEQVEKSFSIFAATLNSIANTKWPILVEASPLKVKLSGKSTLASFELPALLSLRLRALFGVGIRADLLTFCLTHGESSFSALDSAKIGYNKRSLSEVLESFTQSGLIKSIMVGNRREYTLIKQGELQHLLRNLPKLAPDWSSILKVVFTLRTILRENATYASSSKAIISQVALQELKDYLQKLNLTPPNPMGPDSDNYWESFEEWLLKTIKEVAHSSFWGSFQVKSTEEVEQKTGHLIQYIYVIRDGLDGLEFVISEAENNPQRHAIVFKENYSYALTFLEELEVSVEELFKSPFYLSLDTTLLEIIHRFEWEEFPNLKKDIEEFISEEKPINPGFALRRYQSLDKILRKFHSFLHRLSKRMQELYLFHTDINLLILPDHLTKRHLILELFPRNLYN